MKLVFALMLIAIATAVSRSAVAEDPRNRWASFHVTSFEWRDSTRDVCDPRKCSAIRYELSGYIQDPGKNRIVYRAYCDSIHYRDGENFTCVQLSAGESYR